jgi:phosphoglycolate phosphatase
MPHIIWDLDGTLVDSQEEILSTVKLALSDAGVNITNRKVDIEIGPPLADMLRNAFSENYLTDKKLEEIIFHFRRRYDSSNFDMTLPFPDIGSIIFDSGFVHHIVTNKPEYATKKIIKKLNWTDRIISVNTTAAREYMAPRERVTKEDLIKNLIKHQKKSNEFIGVGDTRNDCIAAKKNNIFAIGVLWGTGREDELVDVCDRVVGSAKELYNVLLDFADKKKKAGNNGCSSQ